MPEITKDNSVVTFTVNEWRDWLKKHHREKSFVYQVKYKRHTGKTAPSHRDSMDEAICFGWIDTTVNRLDDERFAIKFVRRNKSSRWSKATVGHAKRLIKEKRMTSEGLKAFKDGLARPLHDHNLPKNPEVPGDLRKALGKNRKARENFNNFAPSYKRSYLYWVLTAKRPETRKKRIAEVVKRAEMNQKM